MERGQWQDEGGHIRAQFSEKKIEHEQTIWSSSKHFPNPPKPEDQSCHGCWNEDQVSTSAQACSPGSFNLIIFFRQEIQAVLGEEGGCRSGETEAPQIVKA